MSVLKNQRRLSRSEFEYNYCLFYAEYADRVNRTSKRRMKWVGKPLLNAMNNALQSILNVNQYRFAKGDNIDKKIKSVNKAIDDIYNIQKPLLTYFNIEVLPFNKQVRCVEFLSKEVELLSDITNQTERCCKFLVIDYESVHKMKFIENMCELHRLTHSKLIRATGNLENTETPILANLIDTALYNLLCANNIYPQNKDEYLIRKDKFDYVLELLDEMYVPLYSYFEIMNYSEKEQYRWVNLIEQEIKLINGVNKSDKKHFSHLLS